MNLNGKVAIVYGGARGIGRAYCEALLENGAKVCFGDIRVEESNILQKLLQDKYGVDHVAFKQCDVVSDKQVEDLYLYAAKTLGSVDVVVANAGIVNEKEWKCTMDINFRGVVNAFNTALNHMGLDHGGNGGVFVSTCSMLGLFPVPFFPMYCASKHAIVGFLRAWSHPANYSTHGIRINAICPGLVDTDLVKTYVTQQFGKEKMVSENHWDMLEELMGKVTQKLKPEDIASALIRLLEDSTLNGKFMMVDPYSTEDFATFMEPNLPE